MKKNKSTLIICVCLVLVIAVVAAVLFMTSKRGVDKEYEYNTVIEVNEKAPVCGEPEISKIVGYSEDADQKFLKLPYEIKDTPLKIVSIGKYTGLYNDAEKSQEVEDVLAVVVMNDSDKVVSYSNFTVEYSTKDDKRTCSFSPTNLPAHQSSLVFTTNEPVKYSDVKSFNVTDPFAVLGDSLPLLEDKVGVDYKDGEFIITNLTNDNLGDVYVRYKNCVDGNVYLGGITYSVVAQGVEPYETYHVAADNYNEETGIIIAVESYTDQ
ncbi:MAG: hypothetical protein IKB73_05070 [Ruminococcus sp.]|nr:hypothetical protein [Ruminococcus sp.]